MKNTYEITKDQILAMAEKCPQAKEALEAAFPGAFEEEWENVTYLLKIVQDRGVNGVGTSLINTDIPIWFLTPNRESWQWDGNLFPYDGYGYTIKDGKVMRRKI